MDGEGRFMKKKIIFLFLMVMMIFSLTGCKDEKLYYEGYKVLNFKDVLQAEDFEIENPDYEENDEQAIIYLFRGQGCTFCRKFISFLNSISKDYGKYFKLVSFEVWNDQQNNELMSKMSQVTDVEARGVPYIVIGDQVFDGYAESYDEAIKQKIMEQYKDGSYDVFKELAKEERRFKGFSNTAVVIFSFFFALAATLICVLNYNITSKRNKEEILQAIKEMNLESKNNNQKKA